MHGGANCSSASSPADPDEFSVFLHQIMLRSSSSSSSLTVKKGIDMQSSRPTCGLPPEHQEFRFQAPSFTGPPRIPLPEPSSGLNSAACVGFDAPAACLPEGAFNVSSSSINSVDNQLNEYDCESDQDGLEGVVLEAPAKLTTSRSASKRSRAAEVHNLSEKRRRSRINEKMKALQNLIPNSNKTDKASMLDEAIEYLKQLQLQVQLLTMRNGVSLYPMCLPGILQSNEISHRRTGYTEGSRSLTLNMARATSTTPLDQTTPTNILFTLPGHYPNQEQTSIPNLRKLSDSDSFGLGSSTQVHPESFQLPITGSSKVSSV